MGSYDKVFKGTAFTSRSVTDIDILKDHLFCIDKDGVIEKINSPQTIIFQLRRYRVDSFHFKRKLRVNESIQPLFFSFSTRCSAS